MDTGRLNMKSWNYIEIKLVDMARETKLTNLGNFNFYGALSHENNTYILNMFIPKDMDTKIIEQFLDLIDMQERKEYFFIRAKFSNNSIVSLIRDFDTLNGFFFLDVDFKDGKIVLKGYYNKNVLKEVSDILYQHIDVFKSVDNLVIRDGIDINDTFNNDGKKFKSIIISMPLNTFKNDRIPEILKNTDTIGQFIDNYPENDVYRIILYSMERITGYDALSIIDDNEHIYETETSNEILDKLSEFARGLSLTWRTAYTFVRGNRLYIAFIVPAFRAREYLDAIIKTQFEMKGIDLVIFEHIGDMDFKDLNTYLQDSS